MSDLKALLFDVDGTLADTERDGHRIAFNEAFREFGLDWHWDAPLYGKLLAVTGGKERIKHFLDQYHQGPADDLPDDLAGFIAQLHQSKTRHYVDMLGEGRIPLRSGVKRLITDARSAGLRLAVVTTTTPENVTALLGSTLDNQGEGVFEVIAAGDIVPAKKPAPDIYHWAMERLGLGPQECLAIEDSHNGLLSALSSGVRSVVITVNGYTSNEDFTGASLVVDQLGEPGEKASALDGNLGVSGVVDVELLKVIHANTWA
jgi:HAD superfamily hydrolase (TIGR01509 family)